jgi:hypothetical protein
MPTVTPFSRPLVAMKLRIALRWMGLVFLLGSPTEAAFRFFDPLKSEQIPAQLSQIGIYADMINKQVDSSFTYFEINSPLWSDGARKQRWIYLPQGTTIRYDEHTDLFTYPESTVFVKNFLLESREGDTSTQVLWETRLLIHRSDSASGQHWHGLSYRWNAAASEAYLVDATFGYDTLFHYQPAGGLRSATYKKWHFPSQAECRTCHGFRPALSFFPAQLKRPSPINPSLNQIIALFRKGIFSGQEPPDSALRRRWKSLDEPIPASLTSDQRFAVLDTLARSYLGGNCSGCHGDRGIAEGGIPAHVNLDFYRLVPTMELGHAPVGSMGLQVDDTTDMTFIGRRYFMAAVTQAGLDTARGKPWDMSRPAELNEAKEPNEANLLFPGYPAYSVLLYRQMVRRASWRDSMDAWNALAFSDDAEALKAKLFAAPWGSESWRQAIADHQIDWKTLVSFEKDGGQMGGQMPPLSSSFIPDRKALEILGEWVKHYRTLQIVDSTRIISRIQNHTPQFQNLYINPSTRILKMVSLSGASIELIDLQGRAFRLQRILQGHYRIPEHLKAGVYFLRSGSVRAKVTLLR